MARLGFKNLNPVEKARFLRLAKDRQRIKDPKVRRYVDHLKHCLNTNSNEFIRFIVWVNDIVKNRDEELDEINSELDIISEGCGDQEDRILVLEEQVKDLLSRVLVSSSSSSSGA